MDTSALSTIGLGTLTISASSALITGVYTIFRKQPQSGIIVGVAALNSGITAATFFTCREYVVSPALVHFAPWLQYARRRRELGIDLSTPTEPGSLLDLHTNKLLDSALSGAITGGMLRGIRSGRRAILPGMVMTGVACSFLQYGYNELSIMRLRYIAKLNEEDRAAVTVPSSKPRTAIPDRSEPSTTSPSAVQLFLSMIGVRPLSDEEYLAKMKRTRNAYLKRIAELELQKEEEKVLKELDKS
ncbi:hypothetical protein GALMADRAFT_251427 [Galerina marginata CBS 339.88]|uniref:Uncharacterized protein n=1 Tax=Galerina marginata (strain CBS 339.88) TaxID=685588 RepID=A0A067SRY8_GALM3|nr:hypothetical protein GALMADRAFT_251427 [Galerina marginata CBS 339.88]